MMTQHFFKYFLLLGFGCISVLSAQLDNPNYRKSKGGKITTLEIPASVKEVEKPKTLSFGNDNGFKTANKKLQQKRKQQEKEKALENKGIITPEKIGLNQAKKHIEGKFKNLPMIDMNLGSFHTKSKNVYISSYDFGRFDGDKVQISLNGKRIHNNYLLTPKVRTIKIPLNVGINKVEVTAINEGDLSPNTGYFAFFDDNRYVIKQGQWMLAKGAKVIAIIIRDDE